VKTEDAKHPWLTLIAILLAGSAFMVAVQYWISGRSLPYALGYTALGVALGGGLAAFRLRNRLRERSPENDG
jgi:hypothetical protein